MNFTLGTEIARRGGLHEVGKGESFVSHYWRGGTAQGFDSWIGRKDGFEVSRGGSTELYSPSSQAIAELGHAKSVDATDSQVVPPHRSLMRLHPERLLNLAAPLLVTLAISFFCFHELGFSWRWSIPAGLFTAVRMQKRGFI